MTPTHAAGPDGSIRLASATRADIAVDVVAVVVLGILGIVGFRLAYGGTDYLLAGIVGVTIGTAIGLVGAVRRVGAVIVTSWLVAAYFAFSGMALHSLATAAVLPNAAVLRAAASGPIWGWAELITTLAPVGDTAKLLAVPYVAATLATAYTISVARRTSSSFFLALGPISLVAISILFGTSTPAALLTQGLGTAVILFGWLAIRRRGSRSNAVAAAGRSRLVGGVLMLTLAGIVSATVGGSIPGADHRARYVLRDQAEPPFDPRDYASPLAGYRHYSDDRGSNLRDKVLFTVSELPPNVPIRLAVLDSYDGNVWNVGGGPESGGSSGVFQRVGQVIPTDVKGKTAAVTFKIGQYDDVWLPTIGTVTGVHFAGSNSTEKADSLRFNRSSNTAAVPARLRNGDQVTIDAVIAEEVPRKLLSDAIAGDAGVGNLEIVPEEVRSLAALITESITPGYSRGLAIGNTFIQDPQYGFSDGRDGQQPSAAGHSLRRMTDFAKDVTDKGLTFANGEQYASAMALMSRSVGLPARVVLGFCPSGCPGKNVEITGEKVGAWVEVQVDKFGWVPLLSTPDQEKQPKEPTPLPTPTPENASQPPPPPVTVPPADDIASDELLDQDEPPEKDDPVIPPAVLYAGLIVGTPIALLAAAILALWAFKRRRRQRRRQRGTLRDRVAGGWSEIQDLARDMGNPFPPDSTRRESAGFIGNAAVGDAAAMADLATFGPEAPIEADVEYYWDKVETARNSMLSSIGHFGRFRVSITPTSVLTERRRLRNQIKPAQKRRHPRRKKVLTP